MDPSHGHNATVQTGHKDADQIDGHVSAVRESNEESSSSDILDSARHGATHPFYVNESLTDVTGVGDLDRASPAAQVFIGWSTVYLHQLTGPEVQELTSRAKIGVLGTRHPGASN